DQLMIVSLQPDADHFLVCHVCVSSLIFVLSLLGVWVRSNCLSTPSCVSLCAKKNGRRKADRLLPQRYTQRKQKQFSRPMTGHTPQKLPSFDAISCIIAVRSADFAYTRSIILTRTAPFVNNFFRKIHKNFSKFSCNPQNLFLAYFKGESRSPPLYIIIYITINL
ncbi:MAG: hypothetical protein IKA47_10525, partial [Oscillospiraceae bacterium]|nr:hypothetical protein [Oscillospiraceae bacterium]